MPGKLITRVTSCYHRYMTETTSTDALTPVTAGCEYVIAWPSWASPVEYCGDDRDPAGDFPMFCTAHKPLED